MKGYEDDTYQGELLKIGMPFCIVMGWDIIRDKISHALAKHYSTQK